MRGGFRPLVNSPSLVGDIDLEGSRAMRQRWRDQYRLRADVRDLLRDAPIDDSIVVEACTDGFNAIPDDPAPKDATRPQVGE